MDSMADDENCVECGLPITEDDVGVRVYGKAPAGDLGRAFDPEIVEKVPCYLHRRCFNSREYERA
jgi:hypothetical protein